MTLSHSQFSHLDSDTSRVSQGIPWLVTPSVGAMASQEQLLLEFNLSDLDRRYENDELISKIYCDVIGKVD